MSESLLFEPLHLPNGAVIPNRIAKAAMEENLADDNHAPGDALVKLYEAWAAGGAGLILTGNVMVDHRALTGPGGVVLEDAGQLPKFKAWAKACRKNGAQAWMQINHPGRQLMAAMGQQALAPSAVPVDIPGLAKLFAQPRAMTELEIQDVIHRHAKTARLAQTAGFTGVQIHAAHGYLLSQFLSPLTNRRTDAWGGNLENRARLLLEVVRAVRSAVTPDFCVAIKLNSADFQHGGFDAADSKKVVELLNDLPVDLVELSGGSYESPAMQGRTTDNRTLEREAYFLEFAEQISLVAAMPVMVTGGVRRRPVAERVLRGPVSMVGMATALSIDPLLPKRWREGISAEVIAPYVSWKNKSFASVATSSVIKKQLSLLSQGKPTNPTVSPLRSLICNQIATKRMTRQYRQWVDRLAAAHKQEAS